jgi:Domain of unknown function (DUF4384)
MPGSVQLGFLALPSFGIDGKMKPAARDIRFSTLDESIIKKSPGSTDYMHSCPQSPLARRGLKTSALYGLSFTIVLVLGVRCGAAGAGQPPAATPERAWTKAAQSPPAMLLAQAATPPIALPNLAKVAVKMIPGSAVEVGSKVGFEVTSARRGYVLLVDIDHTGSMTQIFPSPELLGRLGGGDINFIKANGRLTIPSEEIIKRGFNYLATEPTGSAAIVAILSRRKVQLIDLPDTIENEGAAASVSRLLKWINELRVADPESGKLLPSEWSYDFKSYEIR